MSVSLTVAGQSVSRAGPPAGPLGPEEYGRTLEEAGLKGAVVLFSK